MKSMIFNKRLRMAVMFLSIVLISAIVKAQNPFMGNMSFGGMGGFPGIGGGGISNGTHVDFSSSNLPIVIISTNGASINSSDKVDADMKIIYHGDGAINHVTDEPNEYKGKIGIKLRGNSSLSFEQKSFTIETRNSDGSNNNVSLFGLGAENDWALVAPYNDISMLRNVIAYAMWSDMDHWAPKTKLVEVVIDGEYGGVYTFTEKIKRDVNRLDIANLKKTDNSGLEITGGYIVRIDAYDSNDLTFKSSVPGISKSATQGGFGGFGGMNMGMGGFGGMGGMGGMGMGGMGMGGMGMGGMGANSDIVWTIYYPDKKDITKEQETYIKSYIDTVEQVIQSEHFADKKTGYSKYINVSSFVDYLIHSEVSLNADGLKRSSYFYKTKQNADGSGGKLHAGPVWDYNLAYGNCNFCNANNVKAWVYEGGETNPTPSMWKRLLEDPAFLAKVKARYTELRKTTLSERSINQFIDANASLLKEPQKRQFEKFDDLLVTNRQNSTRQNSNNGMGMGMSMGMGMNNLSFAAYRVSSYDEEISTLKTWFKQRLEFLDSNWLE